MNEFENSLVKGIHKSRYVASWMRCMVKVNRRIGSINVYDDSFKEWLKTIEFVDNNGEIEHLTEDEINEIYYYATNGKLELETSAYKFIKEL